MYINIECIGGQIWGDFFPSFNYVPDLHFQKQNHFIFVIINKQKKSVAIDINRYPNKLKDIIHRHLYDKKYP